MASIDSATDHLSNSCIGNNVRMHAGVTHVETSEQHLFDVF